MERKTYRQVHEQTLNIIWKKWAAAVLDNDFSCLHHWVHSKESILKKNMW
jgi:hypothetical protein